MPEFPPDGPKIDGVDGERLSIDEAEYVDDEERPDERRDEIVRPRDMINDGIVSFRRVKCKLKNP